MQMIVTSGDLLLTVVNDVLDFSKQESGNVNIEMLRSNLKEM
jgi:signal transduction histidine kinase